MTLICGLFCKSCFLYIEKRCSVSSIYRTRLRAVKAKEPQNPTVTRKESVSFPRFGEIFMKQGMLFHLAWGKKFHWRAEYHRTSTVWNKASSSWIFYLKFVTTALFFLQSVSQNSHFSKIPWPTCRGVTGGCFRKPTISHLGPDNKTCIRCVIIRP